MRQTYTYRMPWGEILSISADLAEAAADIDLLTDGDDGGRVAVPTGHRTADARHRERDMLRLVLDWCGPEYYRADDDDRDDDAVIDWILDYALGEE